MGLLPICNSTDAFWTTVLSQDLSISDWLTCHSISHYIWHEHIININSFTKTDTGEKSNFCHSFLTSLPCPLDDSHLLSSSDLMNHFHRNIPFKTQLFILAHWRNRNLFLRRGKTNHITEQIRRTASCTTEQACKPIPTLASTCAQNLPANSLGGKVKEKH